ncbi:hypothetical protein RAS12_27945 [Achromobacter seleniivolatilans]|uniref:VapC45 PIN like domain-containing protein n=1 Tax=Achromobacter seleniivolatilans TaxID=3047478 RepID=A0ABY9M059_9BURK|nr:hypothetical protein [Achromobacter sp. R39]WMD20394.1 hypothetical protein RAS12_27945 [Achromobacter sp. R39]
MNFLFDNNLPPSWAATFVAASQRKFPAAWLADVHHLREKFPAGTPDVFWMEALEREMPWTIISGDSFRKGQGAERRAIRAYGLSVFVLQASWAAMPYWAKLAQFSLWWPRIVELAGTVKGNTVEVPWRLSSGFRTR